MKYSFLYILLFLVQIPLRASAQIPGGGTNEGGNPDGTPETVEIPNPLGDVTIIGLFQTLLNVVMVFAVPLVVFFIIYAGFLYVTARGNTDTISKAHNALLYAVIGGVLILGANVLIAVIDGTVKDIGVGL